MNSLPSSKSTSTGIQYQKIIGMLRAGKQSTFDFRREGIAHPAMRIKELVDRYGYSIPRVELRSLWDSDGFKHKGIAVYELQGEPQGDSLGSDGEMFA